MGVHYDSLDVEPAADVCGDLVLIDDVVTKGRTLLAAAWRLQEAFPQARVRAFALLQVFAQGSAPPRPAAYTRNGLLEGAKNEIGRKHNASQDRPTLFAIAVCMREFGASEDRR